jgi:hypothetical protein
MHLSLRRGYFREIRTNGQVYDSNVLRRAYNGPLSTQERKMSFYGGEVVYSYYAIKMGGDCSITWKMSDDQFTMWYLPGG